MTPAERTQRDHELGRAYEAAQTLVERLELAGLDALAVRARIIRAGVWREFPIGTSWPPSSESERRALAGDE